MVQQQHQSQKDTAQHLQGLVTTVEQLTQTLTPTVSDSIQGLRLSNLVLPEYTSKTDLDRFLDQIQHLLETSRVHPKFWVTLIKQQCQKDSRAYDALSESEKLHQAILGPDLTKTTEDEYRTYFTECLKTLDEKRGKPRDTQIRELLVTFYTIHQQPHESVADFSHRFCEVQHQLKNLLPGIHKFKGEDGVGEDLELTYAFTIKLREDIACELVSREFKYTSLQSVIDAERRYEEHRPSVSARPAKTDHVEQQKIGLRQPKALYHQSQNGITMHSDETSHAERSILRPRSRLVAQPTSPGSKRPGFPGKSSRQPFSQSRNFVSQAGKFKQPSAHRDVSSEVCFTFKKRYKSNCELSDNRCLNMVANTYVRFVRSSAVKQ